MEVNYDYTQFYVRNPDIRTCALCSLRHRGGNDMTIAEQTLVRIFYSTPVTLDGLQDGSSLLVIIVLLIVLYTCAPKKKYYTIDLPDGYEIVRKRPR